jgi:hypothetical protein
MKKEILTIPLTICKNDPAITAFENNPAALSELFVAHFWFTAHHLGTPVYMTVTEVKNFHQKLFFNERFFPN